MRKYFSLKRVWSVLILTATLTAVPFHASASEIPDPEPPHEHNYRRFTQAATCSREGLYTYVCDDCADSYQEVIPMLDHTPALINTIEPTCTSTGYSGDIVCTVCNSILESGSILPQLDHSWSEWTTEIPASYTQTGTEQRSCSVCEKSEERVTEKIPQTNPFIDVDEDDYYYDAVLWAYRQGITTGKTETTFAPADESKRSEVVTFLWRAANGQNDGNGVNPFVDVPSGSFYYDAVLWAVKNDIAYGIDATHFAPNDTCTRAQVVTFLWRASGSPAPEGSGSSFDDVSPDAYYASAVQWAVEIGITNGTDPVLPVFSPNATCTRGQIATFLYRWISTSEQAVSQQ